MSPRSVYRLSAGVFLLFAAGHTAGFLGFQPPTAEALAVWDAMANVHFQVGHSSFSYGGFYTGFGLYAGTDGAAGGGATWPARWRGRPCAQDDRRSEFAAREWQANCSGQSVENRTEPKTVGQWIRYAVVATIALFLVWWMLRLFIL